VQSERACGHEHERVTDKVEIPPCSRQQIETDSGSARRDPCHRARLLTEEQGAEQGGQDHEQAGDKGGVGSGRALEPECLKDVPQHQKEAHDQACAPARSGQLD
jgi:hypothetical protein